MALRSTPTASPATSRTARLHGLAALGWLGLNFPLITLWDHRVTLWGLPLMGVALFAGWAVLIAAAAWVVERGGEPDDAAGDEPTAAIDDAR